MQAGAVAGAGAAQKPASRGGLFLIIAGVVLIAVLLVVGALGLLSYYNSQHAGGGSSNVGSGATATSATTTSNVIFQDALTSNTNGWSDDGANCTFKNGSYQITNGYICFAPISGEITDAIVSVQVKQVSGPQTDPYGITVRHTSTGNFYNFDVASNGEWAFFIHKNGQATRLHDYTTNAAIKTGLNQTNTLKVAMKGSTFTLYINGQLVGQVTDATFASGKVGLESSRPVADFNTFEVDRNN